MPELGRPGLRLAMALFLATQPEVPEPGSGRICGLVLGAAAPHQRFRTRRGVRVRLLVGPGVMVYAYPAGRPEAAWPLIEAVSATGCLAPPPEAGHRYPGAFGLCLVKGERRVYSEDALNPAPKLRARWVRGSRAGLVLLGQGVAVWLEGATPLA